MRKFLSLALTLALMVSAVAMVSCSGDSEQTSGKSSSNTPGQSSNINSNNNPNPSNPGQTSDQSANTDEQLPPIDDPGTSDDPYEALFHKYQEVENIEEFKASHVNLIEEYGYEFDGDHTIAKGFDYTESEGIPEAGTTENVFNIFDGNSQTKWCCGKADVEYAAAAVWSIGQASKVTGVSITTGNDNTTYTNRNPVKWRLYGATTLPEPKMDSAANDEGETYFDLTTVPEGWTLIDAVDAGTEESFGLDSMIPDLNEFEVAMEVANPGTYQYFMLLVDNIASSGTFQISEFTLWGDK